MRTIKKRKKGFTLAEVLVTLAVIGVVASLTIPGLMRNSEKQQWIAGYKQAYSTISQATRMIMADNGGSLVGAWANDQEMYDAYKPYLKTIKTCEAMDAKGNCFADEYRELRNAISSPGGDYSVILSNGTSLSFKYSSFIFMGTPYIVTNLYFDMNGKKGPNRWGKDAHIIRVSLSDGQVKPINFDALESSILSDCPSDLGSGFGSTCGVRILRGDYAEDY